MSSLYLFNLASQHNQWLSTRQALVAGNIANANTPGFKAVDAVPFEMVLENTGVRLAATQAGHILPDRTATTGTVASGPERTWDTYHSGNDVSVEQELLKAASIKREYTLNTGLIKSFSGMLLASSKAA